jgi:hypothetical protein
LRPDDLELSGLGSSTDIGTLKRSIHESLIQALAIQLGTLPNGLLSKDAAKLHKFAVAKGAKQKDFVEKALTALTSLPVKIKGLDVATFARKIVDRQTPPTVKTITGYLERNHAIAFLLFDDTDQVASPTDATHLNRLWALILALRKLGEELDNLKIIVTLRSDVWLRLQRDERGQRDQIDHFRPLVIDLEVGDDILSRILNRRFDLALSDSFGTSPNQSPYKVFFTTTEMTLPKSTEKRPWATFVLKSARDRPRDVVQLVNRLATTAKRHQRDKIQSDDADESMHTYSKECIQDLSMEVGRDCPVFEEVARTFSTLEFDINFSELRKHLEAMPSRFSVMVRGAALQPGSRDDVLRLLSLLWESGFINPRVNDERKSKGFRHILHREDPNLVTPARWNELQNTLWEVHPAFRTWLLDVRTDKTW